MKNEEFSLIVSIVTSSILNENTIVPAQNAIVEIS